LNTKPLDQSPYFSPSPWDETIFDMPCYEITECNEQAFIQSDLHAGHYSIKVDPLRDKSMLHNHGFYYTDTLIEPHCTMDRFISHPHAQISIDHNIDLMHLLPMCDNSFLHGRFHRDFNLNKHLADQRYKQWLSQLHAKGDVFALRYNQHLAGFVACTNGRFLLHVIDVHFRGQGLAKYMWSAVISQLFDQGEHEIRSSVSATNLAVVNLYISLGFRFDQAQDIYHKFIR